MRSRSFVYGFLVITLVFTGLAGSLIDSAQAQRVSRGRAEQEKQMTAEAYPSSPSESKEALSPTATVAGTLTVADPTFNRPVSCAGLSGVGTAVHFDVIPFTVAAAGTITLSFETADGGSITPQGTGTAGPDTFMVLYTGAFNSASPLTNCTTVNDDISGANARSRISQSLAAGSYNVVVTSFNNVPTQAALDAPLPWTYSLSIVGAVPTAAGVSVSGRVMTGNGRGLTNARVSLTNPNGASRSVISGRFGTFIFDDVEAGQTYIISVNSRRFSFSPKIISVTDNIADIDFYAGQ